jgi:hypothetical protein
MEIQLLKKKLAYYKSQLKCYDVNDQGKLKSMIQVIEKQLTQKIQDLSRKRRQRFNTEGNCDNSRDYQTAKSPPVRLSGLERRKEEIAQQISHLSMLSEGEEIHTEMNEELRCSISTIKSNVTIPNEYDGNAVHIHQSPRLEQMMMHHQMCRKPFIDFGKSPEKIKPKYSNSFISA